MKSKKVIVVGIDGGSFNVLNQLVKDGIMPNLGRILKESVSCEMDTYIDGPGQGWASFMTGKSPLKHGIFYWTLSHGVNSDSIEDKKLWEILSENGLKAGVINLSYTFPPKPINGFMVSGLGSGLEPASDVILSYPEDLIKEITSYCGGHIWGCSYPEGKKKDHEKLLRDIVKMNEYRTKACTYLLDKYDPDFFVVVFRGADLIQHAFWHYLDPAYPSYHEKGPIQNLISSYYNKLDQFIKEVWDRDDAIKFIVSDHGFGAIKTLVYVNEYLAQQGILHKNVNFKSKVGNKYFYKFKATAKPLYDKFLVKYSFFRNLNKARKKNLNKINVAIDWQKTLAYMNGYGTDGLYFNRNSINGPDLESLKADLSTRLMNLKDINTDKAVFNRIYFKDEIRTEKLYDIVPDVIFEVNEGFVTLPDISLEKNEVFEAVDDAVGVQFWTGAHKKHGIFIAGGEEIKSDSQIESVRISDLFPTILYHFNIPIPNDIDGRVLKLSQSHF